MSKYEVDVPEIGIVHITKKRGQRSMRIRVDTKGRVLVSMPWIVPKQQAINFVFSKREWVNDQKASYEFKPYNGMMFGKALTLKIHENSNKSRATQVGKELTIHFPNEFDPGNPAQVYKIQLAITKALRTEAERILLPRLREIADEYGYKYNSASVKQVVGRWGSCDSKRHIALSLYLIQLPIELIDYVLIHEIAHTEQMNHSPAFWKLVESICPDYKILRKKMRGMQPRIYDAKAFMS